jgi:transcriptional antiterminator NusG
MALNDVVDWKSEFFPCTRNDEQIRCPEWFVLHYIVTHETILLRLMNIIGVRYRHFTFIQPSERRRGPSTTKRWFHGYLFVECDIVLDRWQQLLNMPGVVTILGDPSPITIEDIDRMEMVCCGEVKRGDPGFKVKPGDNVRICDGPFTSFPGVVSEIKYDKRLVTVVAMIFGRPCDVELHVSALELL